MSASPGDFDLSPWRRRRVTRSDIELLSVRASTMIENAHKDAYKPGKRKVLRKFSLREMARLIEIPPTGLYDILRQNPALPQGEKDPKGTLRLFTLEEIYAIQKFLKVLPRQRYDVQEAVVITVANFKGGAAKTFTTSELSQYLALRGYHVLVIDLDPQASATSTFGFLPYEVPDTETMVPFLYGREWTIKKNPEAWTGTLESAITTTHWHNIDLVASNLSLYYGDFSLGLRRNLEPEFRFHRPISDAIDTVRSRYDVIIIDTPPTLSFTTTAAVSACDGLILPVPAARLDFESSGAFLSMLHEVLSVVANNYREDKEYEFFRVLITKYQEKVASNQQIGIWLRRIFEELCLPDAMVWLKVVENLGPQFETLTEHEPKKSKKKGEEPEPARDLSEREPFKATRGMLKQAREASDKVNRLIERDVIDVMQSRQAERARQARRAVA